MLSETLSQTAVELLDTVRALSSSLDTKEVWLDVIEAARPDLDAKRVDAALDELDFHHQVARDGDEITVLTLDEIDNASERAWLRRYSI